MLPGTAPTSNLQVSYEQIKAVVEANRDLLLHNIVPADTVYDEFSKRKLLPKFVVDEIKALSSQVEKNERLLDGLIRRGTNLGTVCEALKATGHSMLANHLKKEAEFKDHLLSKEDIAGAFEKIDDVIPGRRNRDNFLSYIAERFKEALSLEHLKLEQASTSCMNSGASSRSSVLPSSGSTLPYETLVDKPISEDTIPTEVSTSGAENTLSDEEDSFRENNIYSPRPPKQKLLSTATLEPESVDERYAKALDSSLIRQNARQTHQEDMLAKILDKLSPLFKELGVEVNTGDPLELTVFDRVLNALDRLQSALQDVKKNNSDFASLQQDVKASLNFLHQQQGTNVFDAVRETDEKQAAERRKLMDDVRRLERQVAAFQDNHVRTEDSSSKTPRSNNDDLQSTKKSSFNTRKLFQPSSKTASKPSVGRYGSGAPSKTDYKNKTNNRGKMPLVPLNKTKDFEDAFAISPAPQSSKTTGRSTGPSRGGEASSNGGFEWITTSEYTYSESSSMEQTYVEKMTSDTIDTRAAAKATATARSASYEAQRMAGNRRINAQRSFLNQKSDERSARAFVARRKNPVK